MSAAFRGHRGLAAFLRTLMFTAFAHADYLRSASVNEEAQAGMRNKRSYKFSTRKAAPAKASSRKKKLRLDVIHTALHQRCNDSHNCIDKFSEAEVAAVRK